MAMTHGATGGFDLKSGARLPREAAVPVGRTLERSVAFAAMLWTGLMGGFFYAFSILIMPALDEVNALVAIPAMQAINEAVETTLFVAGFGGAAIFVVAATAIAVIRRDGLASWLTVAAGLVYLIGTLLVTFAFNVPLNIDLEGYSLTNPASIGLMESFIRDWSLWNDVRTLSSLLAFALFAVASLVRLQGGSGPAPGR